MNLRIDGDRLQAADTVQSLSNSSARSTNNATLRSTHDAVSISDLSSKVADLVSAHEARTESRVSELAALYAKGNYQPDVSGLSKALISRAITSDDGSQL
jgi:anti-sigma28 factor (negative regulator of flagellin synthesis)